MGLIDSTAVLSILGGFKLTEGISLVNDCGYRVRVSQWDRDIVPDD